MAASESSRVIGEDGVKVIDFGEAEVDGGLKSVAILKGHPLQMQLSELEFINLKSKFKSKNSVVVSWTKLIVVVSSVVGSGWVMSGFTQRACVEDQHIVLGSLVNWQGMGRAQDGLLA